MSHPKKHFAKSFGLILYISFIFLSFFILIRETWAETMPTSSAQSVPVLLYSGESNSSSQASMDTFRSDMQALKSAGWQTITMSQFNDFMKGRATVPDKSFLLTFDDGRKDIYYSADQVLKDLGFKAVMFGITTFSFPDQNDGIKNSPTYLSQDEMLDMVGNGRWEIESHGRMDHYWYNIATTSANQATTTIDKTGIISNTVPGHFFSNKFIVADPSTGDNRFETDEEFSERIKNDLVQSKQNIQNATDKPVSAFAFPFNDYGQDSVNFPQAEKILKEIVPAVYDYAFYQVSPSDGDTFNYPNQDKKFIKRIEPLTSWEKGKLLSVLDSGRTKPLPYFSDFFDTNNWMPVWGKGATTSQDTLLISATASTTGAQALLSGSRAWTDYKVTVNATVRNGNITLLGRYADSQNFLTCSFNGRWVGLSGMINGKRLDFDSTTVKDMSNYLPAFRNTSVSMTVHGNNVGCSAMGSGQDISYTLPTSTPMSGGVGIETWNSIPDTARLEIRSIRVEPL